MGLTVSMLDGESCRHESGHSHDKIQELHIERRRWSE